MRHFIYLQIMFSDSELFRTYPDKRGTKIKISMSFTKRVFLIIPFLLLCLSGLRAQENDYLKHRKYFDLCSFHKKCSECYSCGEMRYLVKIRNNNDKKITGVYYSFYSRTFNKIIEKEGKIEGTKIDLHQNGLFYICVPDASHWIISRIVYADETSVHFKLNERMENFLQEPDECDCND